MYPLDQSWKGFSVPRNRLMRFISYRVCITAFDLRVTAFHITQRLIEFGIFSSPFLVQMTKNIAHPRRTGKWFHRTNWHKHTHERGSQWSHWAWTIQTRATGTKTIRHSTERLQWEKRTLETSWRYWNRLSLVGNDPLSALSFSSLPTHCDRRRADSVGFVLFDSSLFLSRSSVEPAAEETYCIDIGLYLGTSRYAVLIKLGNHFDQTTQQITTRGICKRKKTGSNSPIVQ